jgi:AcrR family transcriptional regulator
MPKAFTEEEKEWIRERLLQEGEKQFSAYGLRKTNIEELADAAGISKGAFYIFFESKEALFMDVIERAEEHFRREMLASIELPGPSPRARLLVVFKKGFSLLKTMPLLQFLTGSDYDRLFRRVPAERVQEHLASDRVFIQELIARCQKAGIPIQAQIEEISGLLYALVLTILHEEDFGPDQFGSTVDLLLELVAAFCLGEVEMQYQEFIKLPSWQEKGWSK